MRFENLICTFPFNKEANSINPSKHRYSIIIKFKNSEFFTFYPHSKHMKWNLRINYPFMCINIDGKDYEKNLKKYTDQIPACKSHILFTPCLELNSHWVQITFKFKVIWCRLWSPTVDSLQMRGKQNRKKTLFKTRHRYKSGSHSHEMIQLSACPETVWIKKLYSKSGHWTRFKFFKSQRLLLFKCLNSKNKFE